MKNLFLSLLAFTLLANCAQTLPTKSLEGVKSVAVANSVQDFRRFHQGITAFDSVVRDEKIPELDQALVSSVEQALKSRFQVRQATVPAVYLKRRTIYTMGTVYPAVAGVDAVMVIKPALLGTSEPAIAMQGYGVQTARIGSGASSFANLELELVDASNGAILKTWIYSGGEPIAGVDWRSEWSAYTPAEKAAIIRSLKSLFEKTGMRLAEKMAAP